jgi:hypothetical protein
MKIAIALIALFVAERSLIPTASASVDSVTQVGDETLIEMGIYVAHFDDNTNPPGWHYSGVTFDPHYEFAAPPNVLTFLKSAYAPQAGFINTYATNITTTGFSPFYAGPSGDSPNPDIVVNWLAVGPRLLRGSGVAKYQVLSVMYAAPGCNGGKVSSWANYANGTTAGTTTSASQSFQSSTGVSVTASGSFLGSGAEGSYSWTSDTKATDTQSYDVKQTDSTTVYAYGPGGEDGIDHGYDTIYLLLNPKINFGLWSSGAQWALADNSKGEIVWVYAGELNKTKTWRAGAEKILTDAGITSADYPDILKSDPLADPKDPQYKSGVPNPALDPKRYVYTGYMFPYEAPLTAKDQVNAYNHTVTTSSTVAAGSATQDTHNVALSLSGSTGFLSIAKITFKDTNSWTWTNASTTSTSTGTNQSATVYIGGPSFGWPPGAEELFIYRDTVYNTYVFVLVPYSGLKVAAKGTLKTADGVPLASANVALTDGGIQHHTATNARGEYTFFGEIAGPATITAAGAKQTITPAQTPATVDLQVPKAAP